MELKFSWRFVVYTNINENISANKCPTINHLLTWLKLLINIKFLFLCESLTHVGYINDMLDFRYILIGYKNLSMYVYNERRPGPDIKAKV